MAHVDTKRLCNRYISIGIYVCVVSQCLVSFERDSIPMHNASTQMSRLEFISKTMDVHFLASSRVACSESGM